MERITLTITSDLFDDEDRSQEAWVRANLTVRALMDEIRREFSLLEADYKLTRSGSDEPLPLDKTMEQLGLKTGEELIFSRDRRRLSQRIVSRGGQFFQAVTRPGQAYLQNAESSKVYPIDWQPAIIGRPDATRPASAEALAVNVSALAEGRTVSRRHAQITERDGTYYLESLNERNPTFLNGRELKLGEKHALTSGDRIRLGRVELVFGLQEA